MSEIEPRNTPSIGHIDSDDLLPYGSLFAHDESIQRLVGMTLQTSIALQHVSEERDHAVLESTYDSLTNQLNKKAFTEIVRQFIDEKRCFGVLYLDLTNFKAVNDTLGHESGDEHLENAASVFRFVAEEALRNKGDRPDITRVIRSSNTQKSFEGDYADGRLGGDEMAILIDFTPRGDSTNEHPLPPKKMLKKIKHRLLSVFDGFLYSAYSHDPTDPRYLDWQELGIGVSIGMKVYDPEVDHDEDAESIISAADFSMQRHKAKQHKQMGAYRQPLN